MRKIICLITALLMCAALACPAAAATGTFVPSIGYKDGPGIQGGKLEDEEVGGCLIVTSIMGAKNKTTDIYQKDRDLLLDVYEKLNNGSMKLPLENDKYVIRELVDVSFKKTTCVEAEHGHKEWLAQENTTITIQFNLGVHKTTEVIVMAYINEEWVPVPCVNNGDGTVTCVFEDICPVAFCVEEFAEVMSPKTGDAFGSRMGAWIAVMGTSVAALATVAFYRRRAKR